METAEIARQTLRPYQETALRNIWAAYQGGHNRLLAQAATGTGKTTVFAAMPHFEDLGAWLQSTRGHMLIIAHREELLEQAATRIRNANPGLMVAIEQAERYAPRASDVVIASIQTLAATKFRRLKR